MTAPQPATPGSDGEVCEAWAPKVWMQPQEFCDQPKGHSPLVLRGVPFEHRYRGVHWNGDRRPAAPSPVDTTEPPAEAQQECPTPDMLPLICDRCGFRHLSSPAAIASGRAGAGEQQREQVVGLLCRFDWGTDRPNSEWRLVYERRADELLALLGGPQPDGEVRQHRMDADCWCQPVQAANGAWDHQDGGR